MSSGYNNKEVQEMIKKARVEVNPEKRVQMYREIEHKIIREDVAIIPLFHLKYLLATQKNVQGIIAHPTGITVYLYAYKE